MKKLAFAAVFAALGSVCGTASAADLWEDDTSKFAPPPLPFSWSGFYLGGHIGGVWGDVDVSDTYDYYGDPHAENSIDTTGVIAGIQLGYNIQHGDIVFGVEADLGYLDVSGSESAELPVAGPHGLNTTYSMDGGLYGDLTGRVGYATDKTLLYLKGGAAFLNANFDSHYVGENCSTKNNCWHNVPANPSVFDFDNSETLWGWTIGAGVEYAVNSNWSLKAEYQYFDFGSMSFDYSGSYKFTDNSCCVPSTLTGDTDVDLTVDVIKVGVNYRFNGVEDPLK